MLKKTEQKKCKICIILQNKTVVQGKCIFLLQINTKHIGMDKNLILLGVCIFHVFI